MVVFARLEVCLILLAFIHSLPTTGEDGNILIWDLSTGQRIASYTGNKGHVLDLDFSADGSIIAAACSDDSLSLWSVVRMH